MFFRRGQQDTNPAAVAVAAKASAGTPGGALPAAALRKLVDATTLAFKTTAELEPITGLIGQERALKAIEFAANMKAHDYNLFILGPPAAGKRTAVKSQLATRALKAATPTDWIYVYNFDEPNRPKALSLPHGRARQLARGMVAAIDELRGVLPALFEGEDYRSRRRVLEEASRATSEQAFEALSAKAHAANIAILRTPQGFAMAPMLDGKVVKPESFSGLPPDMQQDVERKIQGFQKELQLILERTPQVEKSIAAKVSELNGDVAKVAVIAALDDLAAAYADVPQVVEHLETAGRDLIRNAGLFLASSDDAEAVVKESTDAARDPRFRRYMINVMVANGDGAPAGAPIIDEMNPTYSNLLGRVEHIAQMGTLVTDFLLVKPGALHRANGGYLLLDARKLLQSPHAWEALKRAIKAQEIRIEPPSEAAGLGQSQALDPMPIPLSVKVVLTGEREIYYMLSQNDPDFAGLFKVQADFDDTIDRGNGNDLAYAKVVASIVKQHGLRALDAGGVARIIEQGARLADDQDRLSIEIGYISDIVREADYWAGEAGRDIIGRADIRRAVEASIQRADRARDRSQESIERGLVMVDTKGEKVGQINGLSVLQLGNYAFGRPTRITARVRLGSGRVTDIEREVNLGGPLHSKGVMILWGFLAGRYALDVPLALAASLVFEQSYGGVDGDSASSTELYAILSALADVPIRQSFAVTGSVNQFGEVQTIGGVNEKIEGFFDICNARGLTGEQGVLIPKANAQHLMLREDVVDAAAKSMFAVYPVATIDQGIEMLTGVEAGVRGSDGAFPAGSINGKVEARLRGFAERSRSFYRGSDRGGGLV